MRLQKRLMLVTLIAGHSVATGQLMVDFNSSQSGGGIPVFEDPTDPSNASFQQEGYLCYHAQHEVASSFLTATYDVSFSGTGAATVTMTPEWPSTTAATVQQSIGRSQGQADTWIGSKNNLLRDWIGADSRASQSGNGAWDGTNGNPTYFQLRFSDLPAATYEMTAFMHDVEHMNANFTIEVSTDGGSTFAEPIEGRMTNSLSGGNPSGNEVFAGTPPNVADGDPAELSSTQVFEFEALAGQDVVLRFAPFSNAINVHTEFVGLNGFELVQTGGGGPALQITGISRDPDNELVSLTWASKPGATYTIRTSEDLGGDPSGWTIVESGWASGGDETSFVDLNVTDPTRFYVVQEE
ncbi:MAG: hypothetical protein ACON4R_16480 [Akkermansiaceae bacterium]